MPTTKTAQPKQRAKRDTKTAKAPVKAPAKASKAPAKPAKVPVREAARVVLIEAGHPMHYREISRQAIERGIIRVRGSNRRKPDPLKTMKTIRSFLAGSVQDPGSEFVRVDSGVFDIKDRGKAKAAAKKAAAKAKTKSAA